MKLDEFTKVFKSPGKKFQGFRDYDLCNLFGKRYECKNLGKNKRIKEKLFDAYCESPKLSFQKNWSRKELRKEFESDILNYKSVRLFVDKDRGPLLDFSYENNYVYVVYVPSKKCIKIGRSSNILARLKQLNSTLGDNIEILGITVGGSSLESAFHRYFYAYYISNEFFKDRKEIRDFAKKHLSLTNIKPWAGIPYKIIES